MAYDISKVYTDHPLMDEICYYSKLILKGIVIKNDVLAKNSETENSLVNAEVYYLMHDNGYVPFSVFPFNKNLLSEYGYSNTEITRILDDKYAIPEEDREAVTEFANQWFKENFEEENNYYRTLMGLPPFDTGDEYYIWLTEDDIPESCTVEYDLSLPLHLQSKYFISVLYTEGVIDKLREVYVGSNYSYMLYLGAKSIDLYTARKAGKWDILYMPKVYYLIEDKFVDLYKVNREMYMYRSYQEYFAETGEYYDQMMILIVLSQTFSDLITDVPEWYIRRDIFDIRSCQFFLDSYGVQFFKEIPLKYQIRIVKNLNKLIKYKSSNQNNFDIIDIFNIDGITIYKYWLYKKNIFKNGKYTGESELEFIASELQDSYDNYINDSKYMTNYDDITYADKYWDGNNDHQYVKEEILKRDFTIEPTKYMSIEYHIPLADYLYQSSYLLGLILRTTTDIDDIRIPVPTINDSAEFKISDLFLYLVLLTNSFDRTYPLDGEYTGVRIIESFDGSDKFEVDEEYYDWIKDKMPEMYANRTGRVKTFNPDANIALLNEMLLRRNSHTRFGLNADDINERPYIDDEYTEKAQKWIDEIGFNEYINPSSKTYTDINELIEDYSKNTELHDKIVQMITNADNADDKHVLEFIFEELFTAKFDEEFYKINNRYATDLVDILQNRDYILYKSFANIFSESNSESRKDIIRSIMNDIVSTLEYYINGPGTEYLFAFTSTDSFSAIVYYIYLMVNFFKSYKVSFLDPYITYISSDRLENSVKPIDNIDEFGIERTQYDRLFMTDNCGFNKDILSQDGAYLEKEVTDIFAHEEYDPFSDYDYNGMNAELGEEEGYDVDGKYAEMSAEPYITLNGGASYEGISEESLHDLNGGYAASYVVTNSFAECDIDGGYAYDVEEQKTDAFGSQMFTYDIDGSGASGRSFYTGSLHLYLIGTQLFGDIFLSEKEDNAITVLDDGLYIKDNFVEQSDFDLARDSIEELRKRLVTLQAIFGTDASSLEYIYNNLETYVKGERDALLYEMDYSLDKYENDKLINDCKSRVDAMVAALKAEIDSTKAFTWQNI